MTDLEKAISGIKALNIARIEDLPYHDSPPVQFFYQSSATLNAGTYTWSDTPSALTTTRPVLSNALYFFRHITFSADIEELDFTAAITTVPTFQFYQKSMGNVPMFREPIRMMKYLENWDFRLTWMAHESQRDAFRAGFSGVLTQTAALIGKASITLTAVISAQEIISENFIDLFSKGYPGDIGPNGREGVR